MLRSIAVVASVFVLVSMPVRAQDRLETIKSEVSAAWAAHDSLRASSAMTAQIPTGTQRMPMNGTGSVAFQKAGDTTLYRHRLTIQLPQPQGMALSTDIVFDGTTLYNKQEALGRTEITESVPSVSDFTAAPGGDELLELLRANFDLQALDDTEIDGRPAFVIAGTPKPESEIEESSLARVEYTLDKETGIVLRTSLFEADGVETVRFDFSNVEVNPDLPEGYFDRPAKEVDAELPPTPTPLPEDSEPAPAAE